MSDAARLGGLRGLRDYPVLDCTPLWVTLRDGRRRYSASSGYRLMSATGQDRGIFVHVPPPEPYRGLLALGEAAHGFHLIPVPDLIGPGPYSSG